MNKPFDVDRYKHDIVAFAEREYFLKPRQRIKLWDFQKDILNQVQQRDDASDYVYDTVVISLPRQNSKSELSAIIATHSLFCGGYGSEILTVCTGGLENSKIIFDKGKRGIRNNPTLYAMVGDQHFLKQEISVPSTDSRWVIAPSRTITASGILGKGYRLVCVDELGHDEYGNMAEVYDALSSGQAATSDARIVVTSTVGSSKSGRLFELFEQSKSDPGILLYYSTENQSPKITQKFLDRQKVRLHPSIYSWWHENRWHTGESQFISEGQWEQATSREWAPAFQLDPQFATYQFVDLGLVKDITCVVTCYRQDDMTILAEIKSWQGSRADPVQLSEVEDYLVNSHSRLNVAKICVESWQGAQLSQRLQTEYGYYTELISMSAPYQVGLWGHFLQLFQNAQIMLFNDATDQEMIALKAECLNLIIEPRGASFKVKDPGKLHQDRCISLAACAYELSKSGAGQFIQPAQVYYGGRHPGQHVGQAPSYERGNRSWRMRNDVTGNLIEISTRNGQRFTRVITQTQLDREARQKARKRR